MTKKDEVLETGMQYQGIIRIIFILFAYKDWECASFR
jgi:hypothetical protein